MNIWPTDSQLETIFHKHDARFENRYDLELQLAFEVEVRPLIQTYTSLPQEERFLITEYMQEKHRQYLLGFAGAMAARALSEQEVERVFEGLIALTIEGFIYDFRESRIRLTMLHHSILLLSADPIATLERVIPYANNEAKKHLLSYITNPIPLEEMSLVLRNVDERGYRYVSVGESYRGQ